MDLEKVNCTKDKATSGSVLMVLRGACCVASCRTGTCAFDAASQRSPPLQGESQAFTEQPLEKHHLHSRQPASDTDNLKLPKSRAFQDILSDHNISTTDRVRQYHYWNQIPPEYKMASPAGDDSADQQNEKVAFRFCQEWYAPAFSLQ